jgi:hypothetical protein
MATQIQYRRGTNAQNAAFIGALAEITVDITNGTLRVHDGLTAGGSNIATVSYVTSQISALSSNSITDGTSNVKVYANGNVATSVAGTANVLLVQNSGVLITGNLSVTGNATLSGNILGDRIQNGTTTIDIQDANGNANITVGGTSNVAVFATTGVFVTGVNSVTGNVQGGNLRTVGLISATGTVTGSQFNGSGAGLTSIPNGALSNSSVTLGSTALTLGSTVTTVAGLSSVTSTTFVGALTGAATTAGTVTTAAQPNITSVGTMSTATITTLSTSAITKTGSNGVGNIGQSDNSFNTVFAKATLAQYADLAEKYTADATYESGTVVIFGGTAEVTISSVNADPRVAGVVSTNPAFIMNDTLQAVHMATVALQGRVPTRVTGSVKKGDRMVTSHIAGVSTVLDINKYEPGCIIGKALQDHEPTYDNNGNEIIGTIEVVVGRV